MRLIAAVSGILWQAFFLLAPFHPGRLPVLDVFAIAPEILARAWAVTPQSLSSLLLAAPPAFFLLGTLWHGRGRARSAILAFLFLSLMALALVVAQALLQPRLLTAPSLPAMEAGTLLGLSAWWFFGPSLAHRAKPLLEALSRSPWPALGVAMISLLPLAWGAPLPETRLALDDLKSAGAPLYQLIKGGIVWVPVGLLYAILSRGKILRLWALVVMLVFVLEVPVFLDRLPLDEIRLLLLGYLGILAGIWLGERSLWKGALSTSTRVSRDVAPPISARPPEEAFREGDESHSARVAETARVGAIHSPRHRHRHKAGKNRRAHPMRWLAGMLLLPAAIAGVADFPMWQWGLSLGLALYVAALWRWPLVWLVVVPAALPLLDLAPWTGRFFLDEFDLLMLTTAGTLFLRGRRWPGVEWTPLWPLLLLYGASLLISLLLGLGSPPPLDGNAFSNYWSPYNSLRVAKGVVWGGLIFMLLRLARPDSTQLATRLAIGMGIGLLGVGMVGLWERWLFAGFIDDAHTYRIVSTFSSMHTGGGHIEAYLAAALPFLWLGMAHWRTLLLAAPVMALTVYVTIFTVARGGVLALGVILLTLAVASLRLAWRSGKRGQAVMPIGVLTLLAAGLLAGIGGGYFQQRLAQSGEDWRIRVNHWSQAVAMMDATPLARLFGMGLGSFPRVYLERGPLDKQPATFGFLSEKDNTFLRLGSGDTLYYAQRVSVRAGESYHLELDVRSHQEGARIETPVCEKQLLNSRNCVWIALDVPSDGRWHRLSHKFSSGEVGVQDGLLRPPVELFLYYPGKAGLMDVDNVRLLDANGANLIGNGAFTWGGDYWFFKTHSHLPWHIKNVWVHVLFEQGWLGLMLFTGLVVFALTRLARSAWSGEPLAWAWLASLLGLLTVGMFDSLLDAPRLATLLTAFCLLGIGYKFPPRTPFRGVLPPGGQEALGAARRVS